MLKDVSVIPLGSLEHLFLALFDEETWIKAINGRILRLCPKITCSFCIFKRPIAPTLFKRLECTKELCLQ